MQCLIGLMLCVVSASPGWRLDHVSRAFASLFEIATPVLLCDTLFVAVNNLGVGCYDLSDPAVPKLFSYLATPGGQEQLKLKDRYCYVTDGWAGLAVVDLADPGSPTEVGRCALPTPRPRCLAVQGDFVYATGWSGDFYVVDVSDPSSPRLIATLPISGDIADCEVLGDLAYVSVVYPNPVVRVISIADPAHPIEVNRLPTQNMVPSLYLEDTLCFCGDGSYVRIFNVADPMNITQIGEWSSLVNFYTCITKRDSILFVVGQTRPGLWMVNVADPTNPVEIGCYRQQEPVLEVLLKDTIAYLTSIYGLHVVDIADMKNPIWVNWLPRDQCQFTAVVPPILYATGYVHGLKVFDIGNPREPVLLNWTVPPESLGTRGIAVGDSLLYMGTNAGFRVLDVSDPSHPTLIGTLDGPAVYEVNLRGAYAYVAESRKMAIIDVSTPTQPRMVSRYSDPRIAYYDLSPSGTLVYVAGHDFEVVDVSDPAQPRQLGYCPTPGDACGVGFKYPYAYVADYASGFAVIDVSDPTNPQVVNQIPLPPGFYAFDCTAVDSFLYVRVGERGIKMFSLADPLNPVEVASYDTPCGDERVGNFISVVGDMVFVGDGAAVEILQRRFVGIEEGNHAGMDRGPSLSVCPSHTRGRVDITFVLPRPGEATIGIYSAVGRLVRNTALNVVGRAYALTWDGTDERGGSVSAGVYFCRLKSEDYSATKKFVLLR